MGALPGGRPGGGGVTPVQAMGWVGVVAGVATVAHAYVGYPAYLALRRRFFPRPLTLDEPPPASATIVLAARNEADALPPRLEELCERAAACDVPVDIVVVSDGSADGTAEVAREFESRGVTVVELKAHGGKANALNRGFAVAVGEILILTDVRQRFDDDTLPKLLAVFADHDVAAASGQLVLEASDGVRAGVGIYWRYEKFIRQAEGETGSQIGVTGAIAAVRRSAIEAIEELPIDCLLDDVYWPLAVATNDGIEGRRVVNVPDAKAYDRLPETDDRELDRKVRTLRGNFQLVQQNPAWLSPVRNPLWFRFVSHKLLRVLVPWAAAAVIVAGLLTWHPVGWAVSALTGLLVIACVVGFATRYGRRHRLLSKFGSLGLVNWAAVLAAYHTVVGTPAEQLWTRRRGSRRRVY